jgi:hypothetical protein
MAWEISSEPREGADRIHAQWTGDRPIYNASLESGADVGRTSMGGSTRAELGRFDQPLVGIFRWEPSVTRPVAILRWCTEPDGEMHQEEVELG